MILTVWRWDIRDSSTIVTDQREWWGTKEVDVFPGTIDGAYVVAKRGILRDLL